MALTDPAEVTMADADAAIRAAAKVAIDAGDYGRARALIDLLAPKPPCTPVESLPVKQVLK